MLVVTAASTMIACSSTPAPGPGDDPDAKELIEKKDAAAAEDVNSSETELVRDGKRLYQNGMYSLAKEPLQKVQDRYPMGAYTLFVAIKLADSFYFLHDYNEAGKRYEEFIKSHPGSQEEPYATIQAARSWVASTKGIGRDRQPLERALSLYDTFLAKNAAGELAQVAWAERAPVIQRLVDYDNSIISFYEKRGNQAAVDVRKKEFLSLWGARLAAKQDQEDGYLHIRTGLTR
jgi:outer membrane assembly lipoprotein YfiO